MPAASWLIELDEARTSYVVLGSLATVVLAGAALHYTGVIGWVLRLVGRVVRGTVRAGFLVWERLLWWASWPLFLGVVVGVIALGLTAGGLEPALKIVCGLLPIVMGVTTCLAYMFIQMERYEVERGYKAVHNPMKGQEPALHLSRYGHQVRVPLLAAAAVGVIGGFALLNQGLYETVGRDWYQVGKEQEKVGEEQEKIGEEQGGPAPAYADFLVYALLNLFRVVDVLNLAESKHVLRAVYVHQKAPPAALLLAAFKTFFTLVLLEQLFASLRQRKLLAETIKDFWSPHEPIHERARNALPQYGPLAIRPLLASLRSVPSLTKEQRDLLPLILATIGPSTIPALVRCLHDPHEHVRAICAAALGRLHALAATPLLAALYLDPSEMVRQSVVEALGVLGGALHKDEDERKKAEKRRFLTSSFIHPSSFPWWFWWRRRAAAEPRADPVDLAVTTLASALGDESEAVRTQAAAGLGRIGAPAAAAAPRLIALLKDADEMVRCQAAEALGQIGGEVEVTVAALVELLQDPGPAVKAAAARALGALKKAAADAVPALVPLLQDREESVRTAAAEAIAQVGRLNGAAIHSLVEGLASPDNVVRAQTAEALGTIGEGAEKAAPALVDAMKDGTDLVRAKAVEALGKIGEAAADVAVPHLMRALKDQDNWVSALAAEALGQMGESADGAIPALVRSLGHLNPQVRANAAEALGKMGEAAAGARTALEKAALDEDGAVRSQAIRALGAIGGPTPSSEQTVLAALQDADPLVRAAAVESVGLWGEASEAVLSGLAPLLEDANDQVKVETTKVLPKLAGAAPAVIDGLCRRLLEDANAWVQVNAALALGKLGREAAAAGPALLRAVQTGEESVRDQAMRAIAMIQPPEATEAFTAGLKDASADIRKVASAGWMKAASIPDEVVPVLIDALRDPEPQVRANAAHALARLDPLPAESVPLLIACTADSSDGLRMNAAMALKRAPAAATNETMRRLLEDPNLRVRLIAASSLLTADPTDGAAGAVLAEALADPTPRVRKGALELVESLGAAGATFLDAVKRRVGDEEDPDMQALLGRLVERLTPPPAAAAEPAGE